MPNRWASSHLSSADDCRFWQIKYFISVYCSFTWVRLWVAFVLRKTNSYPLRILWFRVYKRIFGNYVIDVRAAVGHTHTYTVVSKTLNNVPRRLILCNKKYFVFGYFGKKVTTGHAHSANVWHHLRIEMRIRWNHKNLMEPSKYYTLFFNISNIFFQLHT